MNSIERLMEKLTNAGGEAAPVAQNQAVAAPITGGAVPPTRPVVRAENTEIDLQRLAALGMLTPDITRSIIAEEYRAIKRPLIKNAFDQSAARVDRANLIMVTSALPGEGKSFTSINLAMSIAMEMDHTVLLVEADVAKPAVVRYLGVSEAEKGLVDYLSDDQLQLEELLVRTNVPKLTLLRAGQSHPHSTELLASKNMLRLTQELSQRYPDRVVILDAPPLLVSSEAAVLAGLVGQIVLVVESGVTPKHLVKDALSLLGNEKIIGIVLNKSRGGSSQGYGYGHYGTYGHGRQ